MPRLTAADMARREVAARHGGPRPRVYIAGPMTGIEDFNFPAFFEAERNIKRVGWYAVNPAALDVAAGDGGPGIEPQPHEHYMRRDLPHLWRCSDIGVLPGWWQSRGARIEVATALAIGLSVIDAETLMPMERTEVVETLIRTRRPEFIV